MVDRPRLKRKLKDGTVTTYSADSYANLLAKVGYGSGNIGDGSNYALNPISRNHTLLEWMYRGSWLCGVGVDCVADDMCREGVEFTQAIPAEDAEKLQSAIRRHQIWQSLNQITKWARLYGGSLGYIKIKGQDPETPLRLETVGKGQFEGIIAVDRWMCQPDFTTGIETAGPDFGLPQFYTVIAASFSFPMRPSQRIHYSRLIRIEGVEMPYWQKVSENMWGISVLERVWDRLISYDSSTMGFSQLAYRAYLRTLSVQNLREIISTGTGKQMEGLVNMIQAIRTFQANEGVTLLDTRDTFETHAYSFAGAAELLGALGDQVSGALQIPQVRLFGQSPSGMSTDDKGALHTYYDGCKRQQERWFRRPCDVIFRVTAASEEIEIPEGFEYDFISLWQMTETEKADINDRNVAAVGGAVQDLGLRKATALKELRSAGRKTGYWGNITDDDIKEAEEQDALPSPEELMANGQINGSEGPSGDPEEESSQHESAVLPAPKLKHAQDAALMPRIRDYRGMPIHIETRRGEMRRGPGWEVKMPVDYGFMHGHDSAEGAMEEMDCFVGFKDNANQVFVIDQVNPHTGLFDEHKIMLGFPGAGAARKAYVASYSDGLGEKRIRAMTSIGVDDLRVWLKAGNRKEPFKEQWS